MLYQINIKTSAQTELKDITSEVKNIIKKAKILNGIITIFIPHTTAALTINENADPDVKTDILKEINKVIPFDDGYLHMEGNSAAHIKASLFGFDRNIIVDEGEPVLGTWQNIYFAEFDGPRTRKAYIKVIKG
ncbi:MAG: secondary thiamine-phosphate synthase enzyme YjbQ [Candidatus Muiribacteriota bacterium]